jgi:glycosyltransferase involved in cell wall biosynthesis
VKVLLVLAQPPLLEGEAPARCAVGLIRGLRAHGLDVRTLSVRPLRRPRGELSAAEFKARVAAHASEVDVVHLEETQTGCAAHGVPKPSLVHLHYLVRRDRTFGAPWSRQFRDVLEFDLAERAAVRAHRFLAASSPVVAEALSRAARHAEIVLAPLTLDPTHYEPAPLDGPPVAGLIGTAGWTPTAAAVKRLVERVWPLVRRDVPAARLTLAGRGMRELHLQAPGIEVLGEVPYAAKFLRGLSLLLYPLERGSGVKVKVLESIASGLPVVTTPAGAEGIDAGAGVVIEESDEALARAAVEILRDQEERRQRGAAALQAFTECYAPEIATAPLVSFYERMART